jgi:hypothetical protein
MVFYLLTIRVSKKTGKEKKEREKRERNEDCVTQQSTKSSPKTIFF